MHELSLAGGILRVVEEAAQREGFRRLSQLTLEAGRLSGVEVGALRFALEAIAPGTLLEGAAIRIDEPDGSAWCMPCARTVTLHERGDACPHCGRWQLTPVGGTELKVRELIVHDDEPSPAGAPAPGPHAEET